MLVNVRHVKQVPDRKTDVSDPAWLCQLAEAGLLRASFVHPVYPGAAPADPLPQAQIVSILCACWHMLTTGEPLPRPQRDYFRRRNSERQTRRLVAQLERLDTPSRRRRRQPEVAQTHFSFSTSTSHR